MRRKILISLITLAVLFIGIIGVAWYLLENEPFLKSQLSKYTLKYTGRELRFDGPLTFKLGGMTTLEGRDIHFANAGWSEHPEMVSIGRIFISFELSTLFDDRPVFPDAQLEDCSVYVERNDSGELNWAMGPESGPEDEAEAAPEPEKRESGPQNLPIWVKDLVIKNCELYVSSFKIEEPLNLQLTSLEMQNEDDIRWEGKGSGSLNDMPLSVDGWLSPFGSVIYGGPIEQEFEFTLGKISLSSSGTLQDVKTGTGANLSARLQGPEIENILNEFKLPLFTEGDFDFILNLNTEGDMTKIDLNGDLGSLEATVDGELDRLVGPSRGNISVAVDGPNLGALAKVLGVEGLVEEAFSHQTHAAIDGDRIHFKTGSLKTSSDHLQFGGHFSLADGFAGTELDIGFRTEEAGRWTAALGRGEHELGSLDLDTKLLVDEQGLIAVRGRVTQEATTLDVTGTLGSLPDAIRPDLEISLNSPNPRPLASVWGLTEIPEEPLMVKGRLGIEGKRLHLGKVDIRMAASNANIDGVLNLGDRYAGSNITLDLYIANAEKLGQLFGREGLPNQPIQLDAEIRPDGKGLAFKVNDGNLGDIQLDLDGRIADLQQPMGITGNFDIRLPRLGDISFLVPGVDLPDAPFTANGELVTEKGRVNLKGVHVDLQGNRATIDGHINLGKRYAGSQLSFDLDIKNARELGLLFGQQDLPDQPVKLSASVEPVGKGLAFRVNEGTLGDIKLDLDGTIADLDQPTGVDAEFDIQLRKFSDISFLVPNRDLPAIPFNASGRLVNEKTRTKLDQVQLSLGEIRANVDGDLRPDNTFQLAIRASGPDASKLDKIAGTELPAKAFSVSTGLQGNPSEFELRDADVVLGESRARGNLKIGLGDVTMLHGSIVSPYLDGRHWQPGDDEEEGQPADSTAKASEWMFDDTPVTVLQDHKMDIDMDLNIETLVLSNTTVEDIELNFLLTKGLLKISPFAFRGTLGGGYNGTFTLDGRSGTPRLHLDANGKNVRIGLMAAPEQDPQTYPPLEIKADLEGIGSTRRTMASSLDGKVRIYQGTGRLARAGMDLLFSDFLTQLITQLNPFAETSDYTQLECSVFAVNAESGVITASPLIVHTEQLTILSRGTIDLNTEILDLSFNTKPRTGIGLSPGMVINPLIKVGGRLTAPAVEIDPAGTLTSGGLAVATVGLSLVAKSLSDRFLSSPDPCGDARKEIEKYDAENK
jgi:uncharacterized protein involved in outer membrane biogenesis